MVSFLSYQTEVIIDEEVLYRVFSQFGRVVDCVVKHHEEFPDVDARACRQNGYGFVTLNSIDAAQRVIQEVQSSTIPFLDHNKEGADSHSPVIIMLDCKLSRNSSKRLQNLLGKDYEDKSSPITASSRESEQKSVGSSDLPIVSPHQPVAPEVAHPDLHQHPVFPPRPSEYIPAVQVPFYPMPSLSPSTIVTSSNGTLYTSSPTIDVPPFVFPSPAISGFAHMASASRSPYFVHAAPSSLSYSIPEGVSGHSYLPHPLNIHRSPNGSFPTMFACSPRGFPSAAMHAPQYGFQIPNGLSTSLARMHLISGVPPESSPSPDEQAMKEYHSGLSTSTSQPTPNSAYPVANANQGSTTQASSTSPVLSGEAASLALPPSAAHHFPQQHYPQQPRPAPFLQAYPPNFIHR